MQRLALHWFARELHDGCWTRLRQQLANASSTRSTTNNDQTDANCKLWTHAKGTKNWFVQQHKQTCEKSQQTHTNFHRQTDSHTTSRRLSCLFCLFVLLITKPKATTLPSPQNVNTTRFQNHRHLHANLHLFHCTLHFSHALYWASSTLDR